ncbi:hypothetical protein P7K49_026104 [Saguinus oedipus]|uniref:Uncharacterized protein n=1 Tax=Saguinus oedipus TaxID=9490 RepID=A0ABQ9UJ18_SAGOE|nr:hypothetical protein P7K49_026104 [Saguinus oedipus]
MAVKREMRERLGETAMIILQVTKCEQAHLRGTSWKWPGRRWRLQGASLAFLGGPMGQQDMRHSQSTNDSGKEAAVTVPWRRRKADREDPGLPHVRGPSLDPGCISVGNDRCGESWGVLMEASQEEMESLCCRPSVGSVLGQCSCVRHAVTFLGISPPVSGGDRRCLDVHQQLLWCMHLLPPEAGLSWDTGEPQKVKQPPSHCGYC